MHFSRARRMLGAALISAMVLAARAPATERHVPSQYATIQLAVNACSAQGDVVVVADHPADPGYWTGTGFRDVTTNGKSITIRSENDDPSKCIINCAGSAGERHRAFSFAESANGSCTLRGFGICGGYELSGSADDGRGGAIRCDGGSPTVTNCTFSNNSSTVGGGAVACVNGSAPTLTNCTFSNNYSYVNGGALACVDGSSPKITYCKFDWCYVGGLGGAIYAENSAPLIAHCIFTRSGLGVSGGAVSCVDSRLVMLTRKCWTAREQEAAACAWNPLWVYCGTA